MLLPHLLVGFSLGVWRYQANEGFVALPRTLG